MTHQTKPDGRPSKETVRAWLAQRRLGTAAPPSPTEIRRQLNWTQDAVNPLKTMRELPCT